ncbi:MAG: hypothetical protein ACI9OJ_001594 [Myxococcota bacterium]|jgi:hypothetical protein
MFTIRPSYSNGRSRRSFLRVGAAGLGALSLPRLLRGDELADKPWVRDKSVVWLWLGGGPPQAETWDPKPDAPESVRTMFGEIGTALPGVAFGSHFPKLAERANRLAVIRSFQTPCKDHQDNWVRAMLTGSEAKMSPPSAGSVYSYFRGTNHPNSGVPSYIVLDSGNNKEFLQEHFLRGNTHGDLSVAHAPFNPAGVITKPPKPTGPQRRPDGDVTFSPLVQNMELRVPADRAADRRDLLRRLDTATRRLDSDPAFAAHDAYKEQAYKVLSGSVAEAFRLDLEDPRTVERYDTSNIMLTCPNFLNLPAFPRRPSMLGRQMLMARRLCEAGAGLVMVENCGWDFHNEGLNPGVKDGLEGFGPQLDHAVAAFLDDVRDRGLEDRILLVVCGEMGRTPKINPKGGRDHWPSLAPLLLAGGGFKMGQVIGKSDSQAGRPMTIPVTPADLISTVLRTLLDPTKLRLFPKFRSDLLRRVEQGEPIPGLT